MYKRQVLKGHLGTNTGPKKNKRCCGVKLWGPAILGPTAVISNVTMYVMKLHNEAKYLEPPLPFQSFVHHISKHLPQEIQITLMAREVMEITELEKILDIFQNIRDTELGRWQNQPVSHTNVVNHHPRGSMTVRGGHDRNEGWRCPCLLYTSRCV